LNGLLTDAVCHHLSTNRIPATGLKHFAKLWAMHPHKLSTNRIPATGLKPSFTFKVKNGSFNSFKK